MQCQSCKKHTATIHLTEISNGERFESHLCESCAQQQGLAIKNQIPLNELLSTLLAVQAEHQTGSGASDKTIIDDTSCPYCGMTLKQFRKEVLLGCAYDYEVFDKSLRPIIEKSQGGNTTHRGKVPSKVPADTKKQIDLIGLRNKLNAAVKAEDYETAAKLRDEMKHMQ
jgi:protein arginine kinase activator